MLRIRSPTIARTIRFFDFELDPHLVQLRRAGQRIVVPRKPLLLLRLLALRPGEIVTRKTLIDELWGDRVVDFDQCLNAAVRTLRRALGEQVQAPRIIETVPGVGYRFIAPQSRRRWTWAAVVAGVVVLISVWQLPQALQPATVVEPVAPGPTGVEGSNALAQQARLKGHALLSAGFPGRAMEEFERAIRLSPAVLEARIGSGFAALRVGNDAVARREAAAATRDASDDPDAWRLAGDVAFYLDWDIHTARTHYRNALKQAPQHAWSHMALARLEAAAGNTAVALEHVQAALTSDPVATLRRGDVGWLYYLAGDYDEALERCQDALALGPARYATRCALDVSLARRELNEAVDYAVQYMQAAGASVGDIRLVVETASDHSGDEAIASFYRWELRFADNHPEMYRQPDIWRAIAYAYLGQDNHALAALARGRQTRQRLMVFASVLPPLTRFRQHPDLMPPWHQSLAAREET